MLIKVFKIILDISINFSYFQTFAILTLTNLTQKIYYRLSVINSIKT